MVYIKKITSFKDKRGILSVIEQKKIKLFNFNRIFFIKFSKKKITRGQHAHKKCFQFIFCLSGRVRLTTIDKNLKKKQIILSKIDKGVFIKPLVWVEISSEKVNTMVACLASRKYEKSDYINNFIKFKKIIKR